MKSLIKSCVCSTQQSEEVTPRTREDISKLFTPLGVNIQNISGTQTDSRKPDI